MRTLENITATEAINTIADMVCEAKGVSKTTARKLVINSLIYNCVVDEILGQVNFLMDEED